MFLEFDFYFLCFLGSLWKGIKSIGSSLLGGLGSGISSGVSSRVSDFVNPTTSVPESTSLPRLDASAGKDYREYMKSAFPGTNPWEQMGSSAGGGATSLQGAINTAGQTRLNVGHQVKVQEKMQSRDLANKMAIAKVQANAQVKSSLSQFGIKAQAGQPYETHVSIAGRKAPAEISKLKAETTKVNWESKILDKQEKWVNHLNSVEYRLKEMKAYESRDKSVLILRQAVTEALRALREGSEVKLQAARAKFSKEFASAESRQKAMSGPWSTLMSTLSKFFDMSGAMKK